MQNGKLNNSHLPSRVTTDIWLDAELDYEAPCDINGRHELQALNKFLLLTQLAK